VEEREMFKSEEVGSAIYIKFNELGGTEVV
jgi:hypothetical protein